MPAINTAKLTGRGIGPLARQVKELLTAMNTALRFAGASTDVNYLEVSSAAASSEPSISAKGTDADIDITLVPKGTGLVRFGVFTGSGDVAVNGSVSIRDAAGTIRKLATVA